MRFFRVGAAPAPLLLLLAFGVLALLTTPCSGQLILTARTSLAPVGVVGEPLAFTCEGVSGGGATAPTMSWRRNNAVFVENPRRTLGTIRGSTASTAISTFTLQSVQAIDRGWYTCVAQTANHFATKDFFLNVQEPPTVLSTQLQRLRVLRGGTLLLPCIVTGYPAPTISWTLNGTVLATGGRVTVDVSLGWLTVRSVDAGDAGNYSCSASSSLARRITTSHTVEIDIETDVSGNTPSVSSTAVSQLKAGQNVTFSASIPVNPSPLTYSWERNGVILSENTVNATLAGTLSVQLPYTVSSAADAGVYTITVDFNSTAVVGAIDVLSDPVVMPTTPYYLPVVATQSLRTVYIGCRAVGRPMPTAAVVSLAPSSRLDARPGFASTSLVVRFSTPPVSYVCQVPGAVNSTVIVVDQINACSGSSTNHVGNPSGVTAPTHGWNTTQPATNSIDQTTGNAYFAVTAQPGMPSGSISRYMEVTIGLALVSFSFRMRVGAVQNTAGAEAVATMDFLQRGTAELPATDVSRRTYTTPSTTWAWFHRNITVMPGSLVRGVRITLITKLATNATAAADANFDSFCVRFFVTPTAPPVFIAKLAGNYQVYIGYRITLDCSAEAKPAPAYRWERSGSPIAGATGSKYSFTPFTKNSAGLYTCTVGIASGATLTQTQRQSATVTVLSVVRPVLSMMLAMNETDGVKSRSVNLTCPVTGAPLTFTWLKGTSPVVYTPGRFEYASDSNVLEIKNAQLSDTGTYQCRANNTEGTEHATLMLQIFAAPEIEKNGRSMVSARITRNSYTTLRCPLVGDPKPAISWTINGLDVVSLGSLDLVVNASTGILTFHFVTAFQDPSNITCQGSNSYGMSPVVSFLLGTNVVVPTSAVVPGPTTPPLEWWNVLGPFGLLKRWIWICILVGVLILLIILIACCVHCCQRRKKRSLTPSISTLRQSSRTHDRDTVRTNATYHRGPELEDDAFVAINTGAVPKPPMHTHPSSGQLDGPPPPYNSSMSGGGGAAAPPINMQNHPAMRRTNTLTKADEAGADAEEDGMDYLEPDAPGDAMRQRPPALLPGQDPTLPLLLPGQRINPQPSTSSVTPLVQQQHYMNVDGRPPALLPGQDYENMAT